MGSFIKRKNIILINLTSNIINFYLSVVDILKKNVILNLANTLEKANFSGTNKIKWIKF